MKLAIGLAIVILGIVLLVMGINASESVASDFSASSPATPPTARHVADPRRNRRDHCRHRGRRGADEHAQEAMNRSRMCCSEYDRPPTRSASGSSPHATNPSSSYTRRADSALSLTHKRNARDPGPSPRRLHRRAHDRPRHAAAARPRRHIHAPQRGHMRPLDLPSRKIPATPTSRAPSAPPALFSNAPIIAYRARPPRRARSTSRMPRSSSPRSSSSLA